MTKFYEHTLSYCLLFKENIDDLEVTTTFRRRSSLITFHLPPFKVRRGIANDKKT